MAEYEAARAAECEKTARLRAIRLARESAGEAVPAVNKTTPAVKRRLPRQARSG
jgi:hypothetical protein